MKRSKCELLSISLILVKKSNKKQFTRFCRLLVILKIHFIFLRKGRRKNISLEIAKRDEGKMKNSKVD